MIVCVETNKMVSKKVDGAEYEMQELVQYNENGEQVDFYDGASRWYIVQKKINGVPFGAKHFGPRQDKAYKYLMARTA